MNKCEKCGTNFNDDCVVVWKCSECGKAFKISYSKLQRMQEWKNKNIGKHLLKCTDCGSVLDDGNEKIVCKCSSCGNVNDGNLAYFVSDDITNNAEIDSSNFYPDLIECPECGKKILSDSKICSYCGFQLGEIEENEGSIKCPECNKEILTDVDECPFCGYPMKTRKGIGLWSKNNGRSFKKNAKRISVIIFGIIVIIILSLVIKSCAECEHEYDLGVITKPSTCTEEGEKTYTCSLCGETKVEPVKIKEHKYKETITKEATFDEEGEKTFTCENCEDSYTESIPVRDDKVVVSVTNISKLPEDTKSGRYSDRVDFIFDVLNRTDKTIKGVQGKLKICDLFGEEILTINCDFTGNSIPVGKSIMVDDLGMDINQFFDNEVKLYNTDFNDLKFEYEVTNIVYDDGSNIEDKPSEKSMKTQKVTVKVTDKQNLDINYNVGRYSPRVEFTFEVHNNTSKEIKGVQGILIIKDLFGVDIMSSGLDFTGQSIGVNESITVSDMGIDVNQFNDEEVKIYNTKFDDLIFEYEINSIIYSDGTRD